MITKQELKKLVHEISKAFGMEIDRKNPNLREIFGEWCRQVYSQVTHSGHVFVTFDEVTTILREKYIA